jgi:teichuronic acid biosynthesis glycosyltransferase TuaC
MSATLTPEATHADAAPTAADAPANAPAVPAPTRRPRVLVVSTMFPNPAQPVHAVFVYRRVGHVAERCDVRVLAPVPWFPFATRLGRYAQRRGIPERAKIGALEVRYPRFLSVPRFLKPLDPWFLFLAVWREVRALRAQGFEPDVIDAHLAWPDGAGATGSAGTRSRRARAA